MRSTNIADLRSRLTQYLQEVRAGEEIIVRDRKRPIAKIVPFTVDEDDEDAALVAAGLMRRGTGKRFGVLLEDASSSRSAGGGRRRCQRGSR